MTTLAINIKQQTNEEQENISIVGQFNIQSINGYGELKTNNIQIIDAQFVSLYECSFATLITSDYLYRGSLKNWKPEGFGKLITSKNGNHYEYNGQFKDGQKHGLGHEYTQIEGQKIGELKYFYQGSTLENNFEQLLNSKKVTEQIKKVSYQLKNSLGGYITFNDSTANYQRNLLIATNTKKVKIVNQNLQILTTIKTNSKVVVVDSSSQSQILLGATDNPYFSQQKIFKNKIAFTHEFFTTESIKSMIHLNNCFITGGDSSQLTIWNEKNSFRLKTFIGHSYWIEDICAIDNNLIVSCSWKPRANKNGKVLIHDVRDSSRSIQIQKIKFQNQQGIGMWGLAYNDITNEIGIATSSLLGIYNWKNQELKQINTDNTSLAGIQYINNQFIIAGQNQVLYSYSNQNYLLSVNQNTEEEITSIRKMENKNIFLGGLHGQIYVGKVQSKE